MMASHSDRTVDQEELVRRFNALMVDIYRRALVEIKYNASYFVRMVAERGGVEAARALILAPSVSDGFTRLWEAQRLDLSVEAHVLKPEFASLFTDDERQIARDRLREYGYRPGI